MKPLPIRMVVLLLTVGVAGSLWAGEEKPEEKPAAPPVARPAAPAAPRPAAPAKPADRVKARANLPVRANVMAAEQIDAMAQQYEQYMHPRMWRELEFIRQSCDLTAEQRPLVKAAGLAGAKEAAKQFARNQQQGKGKDLGVFIRQEIFKTLEKTLTPDQMTQYQQGSVRRVAALKKVIILSTVARLDGLLYLSNEQRDKITESFTTHWEEDWEAWQGVSRYGGVYFPMIPDRPLVPHLNEQQKKVWQGARKISPNALFGGSSRPQADEDWWSGKDEPEETKAGTSGKSPEPAKKDANENR
jgi:hypothetical protein